MTKVVNNIQPSLFPLCDTMTVYEQPLNERIRNFLRLETLFESIRDAMQREQTCDARNAIVGMIELADQLTRIDIKGELIKEIERHATTLNNLRMNPGVNQSTLEQTVTRLEPIIAILKSNSCQPGARLRQCDLLTQVKQRLAIPGGTCSFDIPAFHYWLHRSPAQRSEHLQDWIQDMRIIEDAVHTVLKLVRESASPKKVMAEGGFFQQTLDANGSCQLIRVIVPDTEGIFPEISGGKHRFSIRFIRPSGINTRPQPAQRSVWFELHCCTL
ncbi:MAG: cell division protein ZapD [Gammaproteobacteria bacterium]|nr:cell division protein ZapD [Gammaproteobacteria bacterium]